MNELHIITLGLEHISSLGLSGDIFLRKISDASVSSCDANVDESIVSEGLDVFLRVIKDGKIACFSSNCCTEKDIMILIDKAAEMLNLVEPDENIFLPKPNDIHVDVPQLNIFDTNEIDADWMSSFIVNMDKKAISFDGVYRTVGASIHHQISTIYLANTNGFSKSYNKSVFSYSLGVIAKNSDGSAIRDFDYSIACSRSDLTDMDKFVANVVDSALKGVNPKKVHTCIVPVIFSPKVSNTLLDHLSDALNGYKVASKMSFLCNDFGSKIFSDHVNVIDSPHIINGIGSRPFDAEGINGKENFLIKSGVIDSWISDSYSAHKIGLSCSSGNAVKSPSGAVSAGPSNLYMCSGPYNVEDIICDTKKGFYVTDLMGQGVDLVSGNYSRGASGFWIENGKISFPVHEMTIAGNLREIFGNLIACDDLSFCRYSNAPSIFIPKMTVSGH